MYKSFKDSDFTFEQAVEHMEAVPVPTACEVCKQQPITLYCDDNKTFYCDDCLYQEECI